MFDVFFLWCKVLSAGNGPNFCTHSSIEIAWTKIQGHLRAHFLKTSGLLRSFSRGFQCPSNLWFWHSIAWLFFHWKMDNDGWGSLVIWNSPLREHFPNKRLDPGIACGTFNIKWGTFHMFLKAVSGLGWMEFIARQKRRMTDYSIENKHRTPYIACWFGSTYESPFPGCVSQVLSLVSASISYLQFCDCRHHHHHHQTWPFLLQTIHDCLLHKVSPSLVHPDLSSNFAKLGNVVGWSTLTLYQYVPTT